MAAVSSRSDLLRDRVLDLDDLQRRTTATSAGPASPAGEAKKQALTQRITEARAQAAGELARRDRMETLRGQGRALRRDALAQKETIRNSEASMARMKQEFQDKYPGRPLKASDLSPEDRARYKAAKNARDEAQKKLERDREGYKRKKDEYDELKKETDEKEKAEGEKQGDVGDPCVSCIASEVDELEEAARKDEEERLALARELTKKGGSGTDADKELVAQELAKLPKPTLEQMKAQGTKVVACRGSVTDYRTDLRGVAPRDWRPGDTWDSVPGGYTPDRNEVVVATTGHGTAAGAHVPGYGEGHGSSSVTIHEAMHGVDEGGSGPDRSTATDFNNARNQDIRSLDPYENKLNDPKGGQEETWAESAARYYSGQGAGTTPNLHEYWRTHTPGAAPAASPAAGSGASGGGGP